MPLAALNTVAYLPALPYMAEGTSNTDVITAAIQQVLGYGILGLVALALAWIVYKGSFVPQKRAEELITAARADLLREIERLITDRDRVQAEKARAEEQRDDALKIARDQVVPLLTTFNATVASLLPILQELARYRDDTPPPRRQRRDPQ